MLSSCLLRAVQTALHLFPNNPVIVAPYIKEIGHGLGNTTRSIKDQRSALQDTSVRVNYELVRRNVSDQFSRAALSSDYDKFIAWLHQKLQTVKSLSGRTVDSTEALHVVVVTHSRFMRTFLSQRGASGPSPQNVAMVSQRFEMKHDTLRRISVLPATLGTGDLEFVGIPRPEALVAADRDNCRY